VPLDATEYFRRLHDRSLALVVDDAAALALARRLGFQGEAFATADFSSDEANPALVVATKLTTVGALYDRWDSTARRFCHLSVARYDPGAETLGYGLAQLLAVDGPAALARRAAVYESLLSCDDLEIGSGAGVLRVRGAQELEIANMSPEVRSGWLQSVTEFLEASMVNLEGECSSFSVDGVFAFAGLTYLYNTAESRDAYRAPLESLMRRAARGHNRLELVDNRIVRVQLGGEDATGAVLGLLGGKERGAAVTELGFGCAQWTPDWTRNAPLHKCSGVFVGVGMGGDLPHIDFISPGATVRYLARNR